MKTTEIKAIQREITALQQGKLAPSRAWKVERLPDGTVRRTALNVETVRKANAAAYAPELAKQARAALEITQKDFATLLGVSERTLHQWEQGRRSPSRAALTLLKVARVNPRAVLQAAGA